MYMHFSSSYFLSMKLQLMTLHHGGNELCPICVRLEVQSNMKVKIINLCIEVKLHKFEIQQTFIGMEEGT